MQKYAAPVFGVLLGVLMIASPSFGATPTTCVDRLANRVYECNVKSLNSVLEESTGLSFSSPPFQAAVGARVVNCACDTDGSFKNPKFEHSSTHWTCVGVTDPDSSLTVRGTVAGNGNINNVEGVFTDESKAFPVLYDCDLIPDPCLTSLAVTCASRGF